MAHDLSRRGFLAAASSVALGGPLSALAERIARGAAAPAAPSAGYGSLRAVADGTTGLRLLELPEGFRYVSLSWRGDRLTDGRVVPGAHDGTAAFALPNGHLRLVRNHELDADQGVFGIAPTYDPQASGGTTTLEFDPAAGTLVSAHASLCGTSRNCAGGPTPWGSWLTCEETLNDPRPQNRFTRAHGYVFEVPADGRATGEPLKGLGRFVHEAIAVDPATGIVYLTEDHVQAGFYRFVPKTPGRLADGGSLEMLSIDGRARFDTRTGRRTGDTWATRWVPIADPDRPHRDAGRGDAEGVSSQGREQGAAIFSRLEGAWAAADTIYFSATSGGSRGYGQVWEYRPSTEQLRLLFESPGPQVLNMPDNLTISPRGGIAICEDGGGQPQRLQGLTADGRLFPFAANRIRLNGEKNGYRGDFTAKELAGVCFSPDGQWLFFNVQTPGVTFAITGPWERGKL